MILNEKYNRDDFVDFLKNQFLTDFSKDIRAVGTEGLFSITKAYSLGFSKELDLQIFEFEYTGSSKKRITLTKEALTLMRDSANFRALAIFHKADSEEWRFSLMTATPVRNDKGKVGLSYSNPKRYSFLLGTYAKINTPTKFLITKGKIIDFNDLKSRFSVEVVNKEFYKDISESFNKLVGGTLVVGKKKQIFEPQLKLPSISDHSQKSLEFAVRLIGRIIFCWFLREKRSPAGNSLMPKELVSLESAKDTPDYYHKILEPIFFEILNKPQKIRIEPFDNELFTQIPYLNGGLFSPQEDDFYKRYKTDTQSQYNNTLIVPDEWICSLFEILETYNFTIDENTSYDEELSIDPEMLGRIFENLLAEINPETGESARKSTGSYYTPRVIVDYMVDESLSLYLKEKTEINDKKIKALISYDLEDDENNCLTEIEKDKIIESLGEVKILDPACGSGAFPIGMLQKIVFILQQVDPNAEKMYELEIKHTAPDLKRFIQKEYDNGSFDYLRKLRVIRDCIYGIDIQSIATEISRLRCFLTLIVDQKIDDTLDNRGIQPLPNLDFKFVTANSLIGLPNSEQSTLFEDKYGIEQLKDLRNQLFNATNSEKYELKDQFKEIQKKMLSRMIDIKAGDELTKKLSMWNPFSHETCEWFDMEWMFGIKNGFDIVIANPPYGANIDDLIAYYKTVYIDVIKNYADIFKIFFFFGISHLKKDGILTYITPNTYLTQPRYKDLRKYLLKFQIQKILNLGLEVFEGAVVPTCISIVQNNNSNQDYVVLDASENSKYRGNLENLAINIVPISLVNELPDFCLLQSNKSSENEFVLDDVMVIKDAGVQYHRSGIGLKNKGGNDLFERLINSNQNYFQNNIPIWYGKLLSSYYISLNTNEYFNLSYKEILKKNESVSFSKNAFNQCEKILWRQTAPYIIGAYDNSFRWFRNTLQCGWIRDEFKNKVEIKYILALLNSKYLRYKYQKIVNESAGRAFPQVKLTHVKKIPIKFIELSLQKPFIEIVDKILEITKSEDYLDNQEKQQKVKEHEKQIDQMAYKLYGLSDEEIKVVEGE